VARSFWRSAGKSASKTVDLRILRIYLRRMRKMSMALKSALAGISLSGEFWVMTRNSLFYEWQEQLHLGKSMTLCSASNRSSREPTSDTSSPRSTDCRKSSRSRTFSLNSAMIPAATLRAAWRPRAEVRHRKTSEYPPRS
jgi:hypothetical protein